MSINLVRYIYPQKKCFFQGQLEPLHGSQKKPYLKTKSTSSCEFPTFVTSPVICPYQKEKPIQRMVAIKREKKKKH